MSRTVSVQNRQRAFPVNLPLLRQITRTLLTELRPAKRFQLSVCLITSAEMTRLNERFLKHAGPTDVITFNLGEAGQKERLAGEVFICPDLAEDHARRYRTSWQRELVRYLVHAVLHLEGYDDLLDAQRRAMKRQEDRTLRQLAIRFPLRKLAAHPKVKP